MTIKNEPLGDTKIGSSDFFISFTNIKKTTNTKKERINNKIMAVKNTQINNEIKNSSNKTPIEIMLHINDDGLTTASNLYCFLELNSKNFAR